MPRRPRIAGASRTRPSFVLPVLVFAALGVGAVTAARAPGARPAAGQTLADGVRRLRAATVGDVREAGRNAGARALADGSDGATTEARDGAGLSRAALRALEAARGRALRRLAAATAVPWWADTASWGPAVVFWSDRTAPALVAEAGDTIAVPAPALPAALPEALRARGVHWQAEGAVTLLGAGRAVLDAPGAAEITAFTPAGRTRTPVLVRPVVRGRVYGLTPNEDGVPVAARVVVRRGAAADTTWTDGAGRFRLSLPPDADGAADVRVEPVGSAAGGDAAGGPTFVPVVLRAVPAARLHRLGIVLLPTRWAVAAGRYAGMTVAVRAGAARGYWQFTAEHRRPVGWLHDGPYTVALDPALDAADTATFWQAARALGDAWGRPLFAPRAADDAGGRGAADAESADVVVSAAPGLRADGLTTVGWDESGVVGGVTVQFRVRRPGGLDPQVVSHELLHALGFGHARGWTSVLAPAGRTAAAGPTAADVAYGQLHDALCRQARRVEAVYGAAYGWDEAGPGPERPGQ